MTWYLQMMIAGDLRTNGDVATCFGQKRVKTPAPAVRGEHDTGRAWNKGRVWAKPNRRYAGRMSTMGAGQWVSGALTGKEI